MDNDNRPNSTIQRYMDFFKLESLLRTKSLYVPKMSEFPDKLEGGLSAGDYLELTNDAALIDLALNGAWPSAAPNQGNPNDTSETLSAIRTREFKSIFGDVYNDEAVKFFKNAREWIYVNCWHASPHECVAMWQLFGGKNSVCVVSSISKLEAVGKFDSNEASHAIVSNVDYIDHFTTITPGLELTPFISKARPYSFEREVRLIAWDRSSKPLLADHNPKKFIHTLPFELEELIEKIIISPTADDEFREKAIRICQEYKVGHLITPSALEDEPILDIYAAMARLYPES